MTVTPGAMPGSLASTNPARGGFSHGAGRLQLIWRGTCIASL
jgi:hypothetical protein